MSLPRISAAPMALLKLGFKLGFLGLLLAAASVSASSSYLRLHHRYSSLEGSSRDGPMSADHFRRLRFHDAVRHRRHLRTLLEATAFPLGGSADPTTSGLYFTELRIGTPITSYYAQVDTGSDVLWLGCASCGNCPTKSNLGVALRPYDPSSSQTGSELSCTQSLCTTKCVTGNLCLYQLAYGDGSTSEGYLVQDILELPSLKNLSVNANSANITFGCAVSASGGLQKRDQALDGILGLGQSNLSLIQQLANQGKTPRTFAHCLGGESTGGGLLVIGEVQESNLSYTPLQSDQQHYSVNLTSMQVSGRAIQVDSSSSSSSGATSGTIIDSGTTLSYIPEASYVDLLQQVFASQSYQHLNDLDLDCFVNNGSADNQFPAIVFTFEGGATLRINPNDYFIQLENGKETLNCMGFQVSPSGSPHLTILGDLVLKDRLVVYDLDKQQVGWVDFNCSSHVTVLSSTGTPTEVYPATIGSGPVNHLSALTLTSVLWVSIFVLFFS